MSVQVEGSGTVAFALSPVIATVWAPALPVCPVVNNTRSADIKPHKGVDGSY
jgi:hypothetical protein